MFVFSFCLFVRPPVVVLTMFQFVSLADRSLILCVHQET